MEELIQKLHDYRRFLELEDSIPYWESLMPELADRIEELKWNKQQKELEMLQLKEPNFFQRVFGRAEEKKELLNHVLGGEGVEYFHIAHDGSIDGNQEAEQDLYNLNLTIY